MAFIEVGPDKKTTIEKVGEVALNQKTKVRLSPRGRAAVNRARSVVENLLAKKKVMYGITTGFGKFKDVVINEQQVAELQENLIISHSVGVGELLPEEAVRASLFSRINSLSKGYSGVRVELLETAIAILNANICPIVPSQGSVGASGDLAPLSHMGLTLMGKGDVTYKGKRMSAKQALSLAKIQPIEFGAKEGLAWNNGTSFMLGILSLTLPRAKRIAELADIACAMTVEAVLGTKRAFRAEVHNLRPHQGQIESAANIRKLLNGSKLADSVKGRVQDSYSLRCAPQVHGASRETLRFAEQIITTELGSVTDNPLVLPESGEIISGGNFHGEPLAQAADALAIALSEWGSISERRTAKLVDNATNEGLPLFLVPPEKAGLHSGLMIPQYTAAALVSENKVLSHPASVDSIPTSANQEDHVSMGSIASRKALQVVKNVENILAIEFMTAAQAIDFRNPKHLGIRTRKAYNLIRKVSPFIGKDRILYKDMEVIRELITKGDFVEKVLG